MKLDLLTSFYVFDVSSLHRLENLPFARTRGPSVSAPLDGSESRRARLTGSLMAADKLRALLPQRPVAYKGKNIVDLTRVRLSSSNSKAH